MRNGLSISVNLALLNPGFYLSLTPPPTPSTGVTDLGSCTKPNSS